MDWQTRLDEGKSAFADGRYFDCERILRDAVTEAESGSIPKADQANVFLEYGRVLKKLARFEQCGTFLTRAKDIFEKTPGTQSYEYSEALHELAMLLYEQSDLIGAQTLLSQALRIRRTLYQEPHKEIAKLLHHIGEVGWKQGDNNFAMQHLEAALEMQKQCLGEMHEDYADTLGDRCLVLLRLGKLQEAEDGLRRGLEIRKATLRPEHASIGNSLANLAFALHAQKKNEKVEELNREAIKIAIQAYGEYSPRTAICINNLGGYFLSQGNLLEATPLFEWALELKEKTLGRDNPDLINQITNLAIVYERLKRKADAQEMRSRLDALIKAKMDASNPKDIDTMINLAGNLTAEKKPDEARAMFERALETANSEFGSDSLKAAQILNLLSRHYIEKDIDRARDCLVKALCIKKTHLGKKHPEVATVLRTMTGLMRLQGMEEVAGILSQQALAIERAAGVEDPDLASTRKRLNELRDANGEKDQKVVMTMRILSEMYLRKGKKQEANALFAEYLKIREEILGSGSPEFAQDLVMKAQRIISLRSSLLLAESLPEMDEDDAQYAIDLLERAVEIQEKTFDQDNAQDILTTLGHLGKVYAITNRLDQAEATARRSVEIAEKCKGTDHWLLSAPLMSLEKILSRQGKQEEAESVEKRRKSIPAPTREEQNRSMKRITDRLHGSIGQLLGGLTDTVGTANTDADTAAGTSTASGSTATSGNSTTTSSTVASGTNTASGAIAGSSLAESIRRKIREQTGDQPAKHKQNDEEQK